MPRVSRKQADLNREIIVEAATRLFRERGECAATGLMGQGFLGVEMPLKTAMGSWLPTLAPLMDTGDDARDRQQGLVQYSLMIGAPTLANATRGEPLSDEILEAAQRFLKAE